MKQDQILKELHASEEKVVRLEAKRLEARNKIEEARLIKTEAQIVLDEANSYYHRKVRNFQLLDSLLAEFRFEQREEAERKVKALRAAKRKKAPKTQAQVIEDVIACLGNLPAKQLAKVIKSMEQRTEGPEEK